MKTLKTIFTAVLLAMGFTANAQATYTDAEGNNYEFQKHFFLNLGAGAQYTLGEAKFSDLLSPNVQLGLGYQFSPIVAARLQANAWQSKGGWNGFQIGNEPAHTETYKWNYVAPGIDVMFNLSNLICGYNPLRTFNVTAFLGGGINLGFGNDEVQDINAALGKNAAKYELEYVWDGSKIRPFGRGGIELGFRVSDAVNIILEGNANILSDHYNSKKAENADWYFNALAGVRINLGSTYIKTVPVAAVPEPVAVSEPEPQPATVTPAPTPVVEKIEPIRRDIFFLINKTDIRAEEAQKVKDIADYLNKYPKAKVTVTGYADAGTGNDKINDRLAAQRADVVVKALKEQYGIAESRISYDSKGSRVQPFAENDMNRVSICIAE